MARMRRNATMIARSAAPSLDAYRAKRDFTRTREPKGRDASRPAQRQGGAYVIQKHRARRTHFDLRLELDGVLKSWAVTRGPSLDPRETRLSIRTEDHPLDYGGFEGTIPKGEYGGGEVMLWDRGSWTPQGDARRGIESGHFKFTLAGERLKGGFALTRLPRRGKERQESWLLVKEKDRFADPARDPIREWTKSIATGRGFEEIAEGVEDEAQPPRFRGPQLATLRAAPPSGRDWLHEIKFDGYRALVASASGRARLYTRSGLDWTDRFPHIAEAVAQLPMRSVLVDGEIVATDEHGRSDFGRLQEALDGHSDLLIYYLFDLLEIDGADVAKAPLIERKARLAELLREAPAALRYSDHLAGDGPRFFAECCRMGLEGVVSKRADRPYVCGRSLAWIKTKCFGRDEFVIGGYRRSTKKGRPFASLLLGEYEGDMLRYRGRVGAGFAERDLERVASQMRERATSPFVDLPREIARESCFVEPRLLAEVSYAERTRDGVLRHPTFIALRQDKPAKEASSSRKRGGRR
jgi:bifunctional non-homologous end joining protein LigD